MKKIIRITESELRSIIAESVKRIIKEDGEGAIGGGAAMGSGFATPGATSDSVDRMGQYDVPFGKPIKKNGEGKGFYEPALDRKGGKNHSISMNHMDEGGKKRFVKTAD